MPEPTIVKSSEERLVPISVFLKPEWVTVLKKMGLAGTSGKVLCDAKDEDDWIACDVLMDMGSAGFIGNAERCNPVTDEWMPTDIGRQLIGILLREV